MAEIVGFSLLTIAKTRKKWYNDYVLCVCARQIKSKDKRKL